MKPLPVFLFMLVTLFIGAGQHQAQATSTISVDDPDTPNVSRVEVRVEEECLVFTKGRTEPVYAEHDNSVCISGVTGDNKTIANSSTSYITAGEDTLCVSVGAEKGDSEWWSKRVAKENFEDLVLTGFFSLCFFLSFLTQVIFPEPSSQLSAQQMEAELTTRGKIIATIVALVLSVVFGLFTAVAIRLLDFSAGR